MNRPKTPLEELREINVQKQKARHAAGHTESHTESHITGHTSGNISGHMTGHITGHTAGHTESHITSHMTGHTDLSREEPDTDVILREIREAVRAPSERPTLKTVTIKMLPELDERVERHCRETGRRKQDVIRDALRLYFAALGERPPEG